VGVLDVVLSEYLNKSHNFTNFIFYDITLRYSVRQWVIFHAAPDTAYVIHFFPTRIYIYDSNPFRQNKSTSRLCRSLCRCATSCIKACFAHWYELMRGQLVASLTSSLVDEMRFLKVFCRKEDQIFWEEEAEKQIFLKVIRRFEQSFLGDKCVSMLFSKCFGQTFTIFVKFREMSKYLINLGEWIWNWMALSSGIVALYGRHQTDYIIFGPVLPKTQLWAIYTSSSHLL